MARSFDGSNDDLRIASALVTTPFTMACWFKTVGTPSGEQALMSVYDSGVDNANNHRLLVNNSLRVLARTTNSAGSAGSAQAANFFTADAWQNAIGVWASATSRTCYLNGADGASNATNLAPAALNATGLGAFLDSASDRFFNGAIMEAAIWNIALSAAEALLVGSLALCPLLIRPDALVAYWPLLGGLSPEPDHVGRYDLTVNGATEGDHGPMHYGAPTSNPGF